MPLITKSSAFADYTIGLLEAHPELALQDVFYGDQDFLPRSPCVCVEPNNKRQELNGAPRRTEVTLSVFVIVYYSHIRDAEVNRRDADVLAEAIEAVLHFDAQCGQRVIHSLVTENASGWATKSSTPIRASRLTFEATSQAQLPYS